MLRGASILLVATATFTSCVADSHDSFANFGLLTESDGSSSVVVNLCPGDYVTGIGAWESTENFDGTASNSNLLWEIESNQVNEMARFPIGSQPEAFSRSTWRRGLLREGLPVFVLIRTAQGLGQPVTAFIGGADAGDVTVFEDGKDRDIPLTVFEGREPRGCPR